jgi:hypothetical protein
MNANEGLKIGAKHGLKLKLILTNTTKAKDIRPIKGQNIRANYGLKWVCVLNNTTDAK